MTTRVPAEVFPPGEFLRDELEARGWSQLDLAEVLGKGPRLVSELVNGKRQITPQTASGLAAAFGTDPQLWMNLQSAYQLSKIGASDDAVSRRARLYAMLPMKDILRRGWIQQTDSVELLEKRVKAFLEIGSFDEKVAFVHAAKGTASENMPSAQLAWLLRVRHIARRLAAPKFSREALKAAIAKLQPLLESPSDVSKAPRIVNECGVRMVVVESLPGSKIDGACFWMGADPVIGLSVRFDRIDNFWFVLRHELEHVLRGHGVSAPMLDVDIQVQPDTEGPEEERQANGAAADFCIPKAKMDSFIARKDPYFTEVDMLGFAKTLRVHPGLVAGQLQNWTERYHLFRDHLVKVRASLVTTAVVDGWGEQYPME